MEKNIYANINGLSQMTEGWTDVVLLFAGIICFLIGLLVLLAYLRRKVTHLYQHIHDHRNERTRKDDQEIPSDAISDRNINFVYRNDRAIKELEESVKSTKRGLYLLPIAVMFAVLLPLYFIIPRFMSTNSSWRYVPVALYVVFDIVCYFAIYVGFRVSGNVFAAHKYTIERLKAGQLYHFSIGENEARVPYALVSIDSNPDLERLDSDFRISLKDIKMVVLFVETPYIKKSIIFLYNEPGQSGRRQIIVDGSFFDDPMEKAADFLLSKNVPVIVAWSAWPCEIISFWTEIVDNRESKWIADRFPHRMNKVYTNEDFYPTSTEGKRELENARSG